MADGAPPQEKPKAEEELRYERAYLVTNARSLLDSTPSVVAGALSVEPRKSSFTIEQAKKLLSRREGRPVKLEGQSEEE